MLMAKPVPPISKEFFDELEKNFRSDVKDFRPNKITIEDVMFKAGQASVVEWARAYIRNRSVTGDVQVIPKP